MESSGELEDRQRVERMLAKKPPISWLLMPFLILGGGILIGAIFLFLGAEFIYVWPTFAVVGFPIFSINGMLVRQRLEELEETHQTERKMLQGAIQAQRQQKIRIVSDDDL